MSQQTLEYRSTVFRAVPKRNLIAPQKVHAYGPE